LEKKYRMTVKKGDIVEMPNGVIGIVKNWDIVCGGNVKRVFIHPFANWLRRFWLCLTCKLEFYDEKIDDLKLIK
jgi:hypothetical protein